MSTPLRIWCQTYDDIPSIMELQRLATRDQHIVLQFPQAEDGQPAVDKARIIRELSAALPAYRVFDSGSRRGESTWVTIKNVILKDDVVQHAAEIIHAAAQFRDQACVLMNKLAQHLDLELTVFVHRYFRISLPDEFQQGRLDSQWRYWFHGGECQFTNTETGQILEIVLGYGAEFGVLDPFFFHEFLRTTPQYASTAALFADAFHDTQWALDVLEEIGALVRIPSCSGEYSGLIAKV